MIYATPRWDGDCGYCAEMGIPPGMTVQCKRCGQIVCFGHTTAHEPLCEPMAEYFADKPFGWEKAA